MPEPPATSMESLVGESAARFTRHRDEMLLLDHLLELSQEHAICEWQAPEHHPIFSQDGAIPAYVAIECMAQCVAVHAGAISSLNGLGPPLGLLLGTRKFRAAHSHLQRGAKYHVGCHELLRNAQGLASFACDIRSEDFEVASCQLAVFEYMAGKELNDEQR